MDMEVVEPILTVSHGNSIVKCSPFPPGPPTVTLLHPINYVQFVWGTDLGKLCQPVTLERWYGVGALAFHYHPSLCIPTHSLRHCFLTVCEQGLQTEP